MVRNRRGLAPWSLAREAGIESATVDGTIEVPQYVQPVLDTGFVDEKGDWKGSKSSDKDFFAFQLDEGIANGAYIITPGVRPDGTWPLDMTGYCDILFAIKSNQSGNFDIKAVMGPDALSFANLSPVNPAATFRGLTSGHSGTSIHALLDDSAESLTADVWNIFTIQERMRGQKLLQFKFTNNTGSAANIETAFMRLV